MADGRPEDGELEGGAPLLEGAGASRPPAWFTPRRMLALLCMMYTMVYMDRGLISTNGVNGSQRSADDPSGTGIQGEFNLTNAEDGLLSSMFMVGLMVASPIFSEAVHRYNAFRLVGVGLAVWCVAVAACAFSWDFYSILVFRSFVGVGEAGIVAMAGPFIDDNAPPSTKTLWLAWLFVCIPLGYALGYTLGGILATVWSWRGAFIVDALLMAPFAMFCFLAKPIDLHKKNRQRGDLSSHDRQSMVGTFLVHLSLVLQQPVLVLTVVSYTLYTALVGVMGYWGPKAAKEVFNIDDADIFMGVVTAFTGVGGTLLGGVVLDKLGSTMTRALYISAGSCGLSGLLLIPCFMLSRSFASFVGPFIVVCFILFLLAAPVNAVVLWSVPAGQRALATSFSVVVIHALGDVPSPTIFGAMLDYLQTRSASVGDAYRLAMSLSSLVLFVATMVFFVAAVVARDARDHRPQEERLAAMRRAGRGESATPLLGNGTADP